MDIENYDDLTVIKLNAREHAVLITLLSDIEVSLKGYFEPYQEKFLEELEDKL